MSTERDILTLFAERRDSLPLWAFDLLAPYVQIDQYGYAVAGEENPNTCAPMTPTREEPMRLGTTVIFGKRSSNGSDEHPAIVTRVWGSEEFPTVNLKVIPDCGDPFDATSVQFWKSQGWGSSYYYRES